MIVAAVVGAALHPAFASKVDDLIRIHAEALGGRDRIAALKSIRATGMVESGGKQMRFTMIAARPDRVRVETVNNGRTLVQVSDGRNPPWEFDTGDWPPVYRTMAPAAAKTFAGDAEFDDPLIAGDARGYSFDYAGEVDVEGKKLPRILVTRNLTETFALLLDPATYLIVRRVDERKNPLGGLSHVVTYFADYRPVQGVLVPHRVALVVDGQIRQKTQIETIQPNPTITDETFARPSAPPARSKR
jgi:hypothetical protein